MRFKLPKINLKAPRVPRKVIFVLGALLLLSLASGGTYAGYRYFSSEQDLRECDRKFSEEDFEGAATACEESLNHWFRQFVKDKAEKATRIAGSQGFYLEGLEKFADGKWKTAIELLSNVIEEDPDYPDAVGKIAQANENIAAAKERSNGEVAGATVYRTVIKTVPSAPPKDTKTTEKIAKLEQQINELENQPPQPDSFTLGLNQSEISAVVQVWCFDAEEIFPGSGSGVIYDAGGSIYTNKHVVAKPGGDVNPVTYCGIFYTVDPSQPPALSYIALVYAYSSSTDVAELIIVWDTDWNVILGSTSFPYLTIGSSSSLQIGDDIWIAGYPINGDNTFTLTKGIVSGRSGDSIKTDADVNYGNSGGAALDKDKNFVGIPTLGKFEGLDTIGYIIGIDKILTLTDWVTLY